MNRLMGIVRSSIPYFKELMPYVDNNVLATILFQQLEYWFDRYSEGFYKFQTPCEHPSYRQGDSWCEELGVSHKVFRSAWEKVGITYSSKKEMDAMGFKDESGHEYFYCAHYDRLNKITTYYRNHAKIDALYNDLLHATPPTRKPNNFSELGDAELANPGTSDSRMPKWKFPNAQMEVRELPTGNIGNFPNGSSGTADKEAGELPLGEFVYTENTNRDYKQILQTKNPPYPPTGDDVVKIDAVTVVAHVVEDKQATIQTTHLSPLINASTSFDKAIQATHPTTPSSAPPPSPTDKLFEEFWSLCPKKLGKQAAIRAWKRLNANEKRQAIEDMRERPSSDPDWLKNKGQFIPHPATYLNKGSYEDDWRARVKAPNHFAGNGQMAPIDPLAFMKDPDYRPGKMASGYLMLEWMKSKYKNGGVQGNE